MLLIVLLMKIYYSYMLMYVLIIMYKVLIMVIEDCLKIYLN